MTSFTVQASNLQMAKTQDGVNNTSAGMSMINCLFILQANNLQMAKTQDGGNNTPAGVNVYVKLADN